MIVAAKYPALRSRELMFVMSVDAWLQSLGRMLADGVKAVKIQSDDVKVRATIRQTDLYTGHADEPELVDWIRQRLPNLRALFLVHGEDAEVNALRDELIKGGMEEARVITPRARRRDGAAGRWPRGETASSPPPTSAGGDRARGLAQRAGQVHARSVR
jgi:hypothetical protein